LKYLRQNVGSKRLEYPRREGRAGYLQGVMKRQSAEQTGVDGDFLRRSDPDVPKVWMGGVQQVVVLVRDDHAGNAQDC
jgi:hypothetical protein